jgi:isopentenyldiphosphate isomerase
MINEQELLFVVDEHNTPLDPLPRTIVHQQGKWHRTTHIWIVNDSQEILCQKRSLRKDMAPGCWEPFFGGHMLADENALMNTIHELREEIGLSLSAAAFRSFSTWKDEVNKEFQFVYIVRWSGATNELTLEEEEVDEVKWMHREDVAEAILTNAPGWSIPGYAEKMLQELALLQK